MYNHKRNYSIYTLVAIIILLSIFQSVWMFKNSIYVHEDTPFIGITEPFGNIISGILDSMFIYSPHLYTGAIAQGVSSIFNLVYSVLMIIPNVLSGIFATELSNFILLSIGSVGCFVLIYSLLQGLPNKVKAIASFAGFLVFFSIDGSNSGPIAFLPIAILLLFIFIKSYNRQKEESYLMMVASIVAFAAFFSFAGITYFLQGFIFVAIIFLMSFAYYSKISSNWKGLFLSMLLILILSLLINSSIISGAYLLSKNPVSNGYYGFINSSQRYAFGFPNILTTLQVVPGSGGMAYAIGTILIFSVSISALFTIKLSNTSDRNGVLLALLVAFLVITLFFNTIAIPFGIAFKYLLNHIPALYAMRYGGEFVPILGLIFAVLFANGIANLANKFNNKWLLSLIIVAAILVTVPLAYHNDILPFTHYSYYTTIPKHVYSLSNYVNSNVGNYSVATLPSDSGFQYLASWYTGTDIYSYLINAPVFTGGYVAQTEIFYPITESYYGNIGSRIDNSYLSDKNYISKVLGALGIRYIIVQGDAVENSIADPNYSDPFTFNTIYANLNNSNNISFVKKFGNSSLYINNDSVPIVYASNIENIGNATISSIFDTIANKTFNIQNTSAYSTDIDGLYNNTNTINASHISNFLQPEITFVENTPTKVTVHVSNATTPFYLVFRETYDSRWVAFYSNSTEINQSDHIAVNGFANAWYMNKTGNYTLTLYYTPQTIAWLAWDVSFIALFATIGIGVYGWRKERRAAMKRSA